MHSDFSRTLALLRKERGTSQRKAAADLEVSQALLSHYENGIREPGLAFVVRACNYYAVSADFLLGRTTLRDGTTIAPEELHDSAAEKDNTLRGSVMAMLQKKLLANSLSVMFDLLGKTGSREVVLAASNYFSAGIYKLYRVMSFECRGTNPFPFTVSDAAFVSGGADGAMVRSEMEFTGALIENREEGGTLPEISNDALERNYPMTYQSLLQVLRTTDERAAQQMPRSMLK